MTYILINLCVLIGIFIFYKISKKDEKTMDPIFPIITLTIIQTLVGLIFNFCEILDIRDNIIEKCYIFILYLTLVIIVDYVSSQEKKTNSNLSKLVTIPLTIVLFYYCFFIHDGVSLLDNSIRLSRSGPILDSLTNFVYFMRSGFNALITIIVFTVLFIRILIAKTSLIKFRLFLTALVLAVFFLVYEFTLISQTTLSFFYNIFSSITFLLLLVLYKTLKVNSIPSIKTIGKSIVHFSLNYLLFAILATGCFVISENFFKVPQSILLTISITLLICIFILQYRVRKTSREIRIKKEPEQRLLDYFENIDFNLKRETVLHDFAYALKDIFDAASIEFYTVNNDQLEVTYSTRKFTNVKIDVNNELFLKLAQQNEKIIFEKSKLNTKIQIEKELYDLCTLCDAELLIFVYGDRGIISLISFGKKLRSHFYNNNDTRILKEFYPNFFVFGFYLQTTLKDALIEVIMREIAMSGQVQESVYKNIDKVTSQKVEISYLSKSVRNLGGDFIDSIRLTDTQHMFVLGDVSGRGLNASMNMIIMKTFIRTFLTQSNDFIELLNTLNKFIKQNLPRGTFFAGTFLILDSTDNMLYYVNCGVPGIFLFSKSYNNVIEIQGDGKVLGFVNDISKLISVKKIQLNPGDVILTCTDGITESTSLRGEEYGKTRIANQLFENKFYPAEKICSFLFDDIFSFTAKGVEDDTSVIVIKIKE